MCLTRGLAITNVMLQIVQKALLSKNHTQDQHTENRVFGLNMKQGHYSVQTGRPSSAVLGCFHLWECN